MALSSKALQNKRAKKAQKRKETRRPAGAASQYGLAPEWIAAAEAPIADVLAPEGLFELGLGSIWFSRRLPDGRYAISLFLIDSYCLGVKNVMFGIDSPKDYQTRINQFRNVSKEVFVTRDPAYVRKLVESAEAYGRELGFEPHPDYKYAKMLFGNVDALACEEVFHFGRDGQPFYVPGEDSPAVQRRVMKQLEKKALDPMSLLTGNSILDV